MGIFDQAPPGYPPSPNQQPGTPPQQQPQYPPASPPQQQWGQPAPQTPPGNQYPLGPPSPAWQQPAPGYGGPPSQPWGQPQQPPPGTFPPAPQGYAPPAYGQQPTPQAPPPGYGAPPQGGGYRSPFDSLNGAKVFGDNVPFWSQGDAGTYAVIVGEVRRFAARKGNVDTYSVEKKIIFSSNPKVPVGSGRCKQEQASKEGADGRIKKFIMAAGNVSEAGVDDAAYHASYGEQQIFRGTILIAEVNEGTSNQGRPFTNVVYKHPSPDEFKRLAAMAPAVDPSWRPAPLQAALLR